MENGSDEREAENGTRRTERGIGNNQGNPRNNPGAITRKIIHEIVRETHGKYRIEYVSFHRTKYGMYIHREIGRVFGYNSG